jgi:hypothetical protein
MQLKKKLEFKHAVDIGGYIYWWYRVSNFKKFSSGWKNQIWFGIRLAKEFPYEPRTVGFEMQRTRCRFRLEVLKIRKPKSGFLSM